LPSKEGDWSHILRPERKETWREKILDKKYKNIFAEIGIKEG
jgi:hypothetical protein